MGIIEITNANALMSEINEKNFEKINQKLNSINYQSKNLENILTNFNDKLGQTLAPYKDNVMNSDKILLNQNNSEKFKFYENFQQISDKCYQLENSINEAEQNLVKKEEMREEKIKDSGNMIDNTNSEINNKNIQILKIEEEKHNLNNFITEYKQEIESYKLKEQKVL